MISAASARALSDAQARDLWEKYLEEQITAAVLRGENHITLQNGFFGLYMRDQRPSLGHLALWRYIEEVCTVLRNHPLNYKVELEDVTSPLSITEFRRLHISW